MWCWLWYNQAQTQEIPKSASCPPAMYIAAGFRESGNLGMHSSTHTMSCANGYFTWHQNVDNVSIFALGSGSSQVSGMHRSWEKQALLVVTCHSITRVHQADRFGNRIEVKRLWILVSTPLHVYIPDSTTAMLLQQSALDHQTV